MRLTRPRSKFILTKRPGGLRGDLGVFEYPSGWIVRFSSIHASGFMFYGPNRRTRNEAIRAWNKLVERMEGRK